MSEQTQFELTDPPSDGITNVCFSPDSKNLLVSSWDSVNRMDKVER
jgi:WD40 repeat protein